ncbi:MAG: restriction endonuclease subunit S [Gemmatimonadaceae bacterium]
MIDALKPYRAYKDSGVPWLGQVPEHWEVRRQRNVVQMLVSTVDKHAIQGELPVRLCNYVDVYKNDRITAGIPFMRASASSMEVERFRLKSGDVLITKDSEAWDDIGVPALVEYEAPDLVCGYHLAILRPREGVMRGPFLLRALQSEGVAAQYHVSANGVTRYGLSHDAIKSVQIPVPTLGEQTAIVRFLDHADRRIRRYIRAKQKLIKLLGEQKQAIVQRAVTRGLDPNVRLKSSGLEWLGDIPEHWEVRRLRTIVRRIDQGVSPQADAALADGEAWGVLKAGCVNRGVFRDTEHKRLPNGFVIDQSLAVHTGDVLVSRANGSPALVGSVARVAAIRYQLILSDKTFRLVFQEPRIADFAVAAMNTRYWRVQVEQALSGADGLANNLPLSSLKDFAVALPPLEEGERIAAVLDGTSGSLTSAILRTDREITLLREFRTRLIADVVTGKLDVRAAAAKLPDESGEPDEVQALDGAEVEGDNGEPAEDGADAVLEEVKT